jgi:hypothetical protein
MNESTLFEHVRMVAQAVLDHLGRHAPPWRVISVGWTPDPQAEQPEGDLVIALTSRYQERSRSLPESAGQSPVSVVLGSQSHGREESVAAYYTLGVPEADAIAALASQIQDHAMEASWGQPLPPCPDHAHPLEARVIDGVAVWECPRSHEHYRQAIVTSLP